MSSTTRGGLGRGYTSNPCYGHSSMASTRTTMRPVSSCSATSCDQSRRTITAAATSTTLGGVGPSVTLQLLTGTTGSMPCCTLSLSHCDVRLKGSIFATCWTPSPRYRPTSVTACARGSSETPPQPNPATLSLRSPTPSRPETLLAMTCVLLTESSPNVTPASTPPSGPKPWEYRRALPHSGTLLRLARCREGGCVPSSGAACYHRRSLPRGR